jgi:hypothetical protein
MLVDLAHRVVSLSCRRRVRAGAGERCRSVLPVRVVGS